MPVDESGRSVSNRSAHPFAAFLTDSQRQAHALGDKEAMAAADACALEDALEASRAEVRRRTGARASAVDPRRAQESLARRAEADLAAQGFQLVESAGCAPDCLLVALLQHAIGEYAERLSSSLASKVSAWRDRLVRMSRDCLQRGERDRSIAPGDRLHADDPLMPWLAEGILGKGTRVDFYCADADGKAVNFHSIGMGAKSVKIFDCGGSFKAIVSHTHDWRRQRTDQRA